MTREQQADIWAECWAAKARVEDLRNLVLRARENQINTMDHTPLAAKARRTTRTAEKLLEEAIQDLERITKLTNRAAFDHIHELKFM